MKLPRNLLKNNLSFEKPTATATNIYTTYGELTKCKSVKKTKTLKEVLSKILTLS